MVASCSTDVPSSLEGLQQLGVGNGLNLASHNHGHPIPAISADGSVATSVPVQVTAVDGSVSTFRVTNIVPSFSYTARHTADCQGTPTSGSPFPIDEGPSVAPMVLDFSGAGTARTSATRQHMRTGATRTPANRQRTRTGRPHTVDVGTSPVQGPIGPPQREGAPSDYKSFGRCDQVCQYCHAIFWLEEKRTGLAASAAPQYQRCCAGGRAFLRTYARGEKDDYEDLLCISVMRQSW
ncbi:hypothetical protein CTI12_AA478220 [Artemisia annua]|uniref:Uncharacterized protein n=1 Tax=Artemisia annua TaxID=35608 RepID=A0A2U1LL92_ARTAN|nr:hypothetical protein CTI12_AA478220 [Artemisia annua]